MSYSVKFEGFHNGEDDDYDLGFGAVYTRQ
jgi:hypothetical protein